MKINRSFYNNFSLSLFLYLTILVQLSFAQPKSVILDFLSWSYADTVNSFKKIHGQLKHSEDLVFIDGNSKDWETQFRHAIQSMKPVNGHIGFIQISAHGLPGQITLGREYEETGLQEGDWKWRIQWDLDIITIGKIIKESVRYNKHLRHVNIELLICNGGTPSPKEDQIYSEFWNPSAAEVLYNTLKQTSIIQPAIAAPIGLIGAEEKNDYKIEIGNENEFHFIPGTFILLLDKNRDTIPLDMLGVYSEEPKINFGDRVVKEFFYLGKINPNLVPMHSNTVKTVVIHDEKLDSITYYIK